MSYGFADICKAGNPILLTLYPPTTITGTADGQPITLTSTSGISNQGLVVPVNNNGNATCNVASGLSPSFLGSSSATNFNFIPFSGASFASAIPAGNWRLAVTGRATETYNFDLASASPIDAAGVARVWLPSFNYTVDQTTGFISKITLKLYLYDDAQSAYVEVQDLSAFEASIGGLKANDGATGGISFSCSDNTNPNGTPASDSLTLARASGTNIYTVSGFTRNWKPEQQLPYTRTAADNICNARLSYTMRGTQINFTQSAY